MNLTAQILADADRCVLCGMCLPHCPTYGLTRNEAESPRGRIALMLALARGQLEPTPQLRGHLERCLGCRACEAMCPSQVRYARLLRNSREQLAELQPMPHRLADRLANPDQRRLLRTGVRLARWSGLPQLASAMPALANNRLGRLLLALPATPTAPALPEFTPARGNERGRLALFTGCTGDLFERQLLHDAVRLLSALGYGVHIPTTQGCCGALHAQQGDGTRARALAQKNLAAFAAQPVEAILSVASGCGALLHEYDELLDSNEAADFAGKVQDINVFLARIDWPADFMLQSLPQKVLVHEACSLRNVLRGGNSLYALLRRIPQLVVEPLPHNEQCCGAAGSYFLEQPEAAEALRAPKVAAVKALSARYLASANIGCTMHLGAGLRAAGLNVEVVHPVSLLARQLP